MHFLKIIGKRGLSKEAGVEGVAPGFQALSFVGQQKGSCGQGSMEGMALTHILPRQTLRFAAPADDPGSGSLDLRRASYLEVRVFADMIKPG